MVFHLGPSSNFLAAQRCATNNISVLQSFALSPALCPSEHTKKIFINPPQNVAKTFGVDPLPNSSKQIDQFFGKMSMLDRRALFSILNQSVYSRTQVFKNYSKFDQLIVHASHIAPQARKEVQRPESMVLSIKNFKRTIVFLENHQNKSSHDSFLI